MTQKIRQIGNSSGIIIPKAYIKACNIEENVTISVKDGSIIITPAKNVKVRKGWDEQFEKAFAAGEFPDKNEFDSLINEFDENEW